MRISSWVCCIDTAIKTMHNEINDYVLGEDFEQHEWMTWNEHEGKPYSLFRRNLIDFIDKHPKTNQSLFPCKTTHTEDMKKAIEYSIVSQFNFIHVNMKNHSKFEIKNLRESAIMEAILCTGYGDYGGYGGYDENKNYEDIAPSLYSKVCLEYKCLWNAAEKIQIQWRKSISDPKFALCRKRLMKEFEEMVK